MFEVYKFSENEILAFVLVLIRISVCFAIWPIFGASNVPASIKILTSLALAFVTFPLVGWKTLNIDFSSGIIIYLALKEALIGVLLGFVARLFFFALSICGEFVSLSIGLSADRIYNPGMDTSSTVIEQFYVMFGSLLFFAINGHHYLISGLLGSFQAVSLAKMDISVGSFSILVSLGQSILVSGIQLAAPIVVTMFLLNVAFGVVSRAVPQINVLVTSFSVNILIGLFILVVSVPLLSTSMDELLKSMLSEMFRVLKSF